MRTSMIQSLVVLGLVGGMGSVSVAQVASTPTATASQSESGRHHGHHRRHQFMLGVCVGQVLATQGIDLPVPTPGQKPNPDDATKAAFKAAIEHCRGLLKPAPSGNSSNNGSSANPGSSTSAPQ